MSTVLVTGSAGFIGFHLVKALLETGHRIIGVDNLNDYYDPALKQDRLKCLADEALKHGKNISYQFVEMDLADEAALFELFECHNITQVVNLAAQAGVRYSIDNPKVYIESNLVGFANVLEACRHYAVQHLVYASSSSVYGMNHKQPFSTNDCVDYPISLYAATKKSNELMAHTYSHLYGIPVTGLRFFTVYGPWGRPDMAYFKFTKSILEGRSIDVFNHGVMQRDFTYIDDIVDGVLRIMTSPPSSNINEVSAAQPPYRLYNIGNNQPVSLRDFITAIETACGQKAIENLLPMQPGDVPITYANIDPLSQDLGFKPKTSIDQGISEFVAWYRSYYAG